MNPHPRVTQPSPPSWARLLARGALFAAAAATSIALIGCGGSGPSGEPVTLTVSQDFGNELIEQRRVVKLGKAPTVMRLLQREFDAVETSYGGRFITNIASRGARVDPPTDWIFYLNGRESELGAADVKVAPGDHVQWDLHRWDAAKAMNRTVGAYPLPLTGSRDRVAFDCRADRPVCAQARRRLSEAGVHLDAKSAAHLNQVVVGSWDRIAGIDGVPDLTAPVDASGVFGTFVKDGIELLGAGGERVLKFGRGSGVVAAVERGQRGSTWIVSGVDGEGTARAVGLLDAEVLRNKFAVATDGESVAALPIVD